MAKPEWGAKRTCPKCATRFYDLGKDSPVTCINCGNQWEPEAVLKSKQPLPYDAPKAAVVPEKQDEDLAAEEELIEEGEPSADDDIDLGGDEDLGVETSDDEDENS